MIVHAGAKINLDLRVYPRASDGYHPLSSIFLRLDGIQDELDITITQRGAIDLDVIGADLGDPDDNLIVHAIHAWRNWTRDDRGVHVRLAKRIPFAAGLGGGSSDAAAVLRTLNATSSTPLTEEELAGRSVSLGSDVPFFVSGFHCAAAAGRGEWLVEIPSPPVAPALIVQPPTGISTVEAYSRLAARGYAPLMGHRWAAADLADWDRIAEQGVNDFEAIAQELVPEIAAILDALGDRALFATLCGSGSACIGIFESDGERDAAMAELGGIPCRTAG